MEESELDKSEQATPFKLNRARQKGTVARGMDLGFFTALIAFLAFAWLAGSTAAVSLARASGITLLHAGNLGGAPGALPEEIGRLFSAAASPLLLLAGAIFAVVMFFEFLQVGPVFSVEPLKPDFKRINPAQGLKRLFSWRMLVEALKSSVKLAAYGAIGCLVIAGALKNEALAMTDAQKLISAIAAISFKLLLFCGLAALFFASVDQIWARREFSKKMRMSRREMKREHKDREGDPRFKQKRKQFHAEFAKMAQSLRNARSADVILTNPTHFAVALRYVAAATDAPVIVSRGAGALAERIRDIAFVHGVQIIENAPLARALYRQGVLDSEIPETFFAPVAELYRKYDLVRKAAA